VSRTRSNHSAFALLIAAHVMLLGLAAQEVCATNKTGDHQQNTGATEKADKADGSTEKATEDDSTAAAEKKSTDAKPDKESAKTHLVKTKPIKIELEFDGVFEAKNTTPIVLRPEQWSTLKVLKAVDHGTRVERGDLLVALDTEEIDQAIADLRKELKLAQISYEQAQTQLAVLEKTTKLNLEAAKRKIDAAREDYRFYDETARPLTYESAEKSLESAKNYLEYQQEELDQLEKMYASDDLTEETEAIVLRRARNALDRAKFSFKQSQASYDQLKNYLLPRHDISQKDAAERAELAYRIERETLPAALTKQRLEVEKQRVALERQREKLAELERDRAGMNVKAPTEGIVYYGDCIRGKWQSVQTYEKKLRRGGTLTPQDVFMTVVETHPLFVRAAVEEKQLTDLTVGLKGSVAPVAFPAEELPVIVQSVSLVPLDGKYDTTLSLGGKYSDVMPGMNGKVTLTVYEKEDGLSVPPQAIGSDDAKTKFVMKVNKNGKHQKVLVKTGRQTDQWVEIVAGLRPGDKVLAEFPQK